MAECDQTGCGCSAGVSFDGVSPDYKCRLWAVIAINASMFAVEMGAGVLAGSQALQADALDFFGDTLTYGLSLAVIGLSLRARATAALVKGVTLALMGLWVLGSTVWHTLVLGIPRAEVMGLIGFLALAANLASVLILLKYKDGDANVRSVWLCSRNDAIGNVAVMVAALGVWSTGTGWPDVLVAAAIAALFLQSATKILRQALDEWRLPSGGRAEMVLSPVERGREKRTMSARKWLFLAALLAIAATGSMALAQGQGQQQMPMIGPGMHGMMGQQMMGPGMMGWGNQGMMGQGMMGPDMMMGYGPMMEGRLAYIKAELGITDAQAEAWNGYVSAVKARATTMQGMHTTMMQTMQSGSAVERMEAHTQAMQGMVEGMRALKPATETLYKVLSDEQKKKADLLLGAGCCMM